MKLELSRLHPDFGARVRGIDLATPLDDVLRIAIENALDAHGILLFRGQSLTQDQQISMAKSFGRLDSGFKKVSKAPDRFDYEECWTFPMSAMTAALLPVTIKKLSEISQTSSGIPTVRFRRPQLPTQCCKQSSCQRVAVSRSTRTAASPSKHCRADQQMALEGLVATHHALHSRCMLGDDNYRDDQLAAIPPAEWPILKKQLSTGRTSLFIGAHAQAIIGMPVPEGRMLLMDLLEHATHPDRVYRHEWQIGDVVMWDNRTMLHRGRRWNISERPELRRTTVLANAS